LSDEADDAQLLLVETYEALIDRGWPMGDSDGDFAATNASKTASREDPEYSDAPRCAPTALP